MSESESPAWWNKYIGIPFVEKGRDENGLDCYGLLQLVFKQERGIILRDYLEVYDNVNDKEILKAAIESGRLENDNWIEPPWPSMFDVIILRMRGVPIHLGIVTKPGHMLHCAKDINTVHEKYNSMLWKNRIVGFNRWAR